MRKFSHTHAVPGLLALAALTLGSAACTSTDPRFSDRERAYLYGPRNATINAEHRAAADAVSYWEGNGRPGQPRIEIRIAEQRAYYYKGDVLVGVSEVSTGKEGHDTPPGTFKVIQKDKEHRSSEYGDYVDPVTKQVVVKDVTNGKDPKPPGTVFQGSSMPFFMRVVGGVGMHAGYLPGVAASHGCIRMPESMAENFFQETPMGTPVTIVR